MHSVGPAVGGGRHYGRMQKLEAHEMPRHKVFSSDYDFRIPD